ncbi:GbsR/MarR family transcriptional regulator [Virgibacillus siamensis]|uniref:GbsR/MarR family transcriptional regulator n=1 Tax=Virgibacillus siamensis TaxID=480071 RepID=UPI000984C565|nr:GbsR/MarR family transcriptional regulator [Virgibacillus siamensis]
MDNTQHNLESVKDQFIEKIADNMHSFGVATSVGRVLGIIYMHGAPMTLDELSAETGMSKTRMSQVVREMMELNIAEKVFKKGIRKDLYQVEQDYYQTFISLFTSNWQKAISKSRNFENRLKRQLENLHHKDSLTEEDEAAVNEVLAELHEWTSYYDWIRRLTEFFESGEIFKYVPKEK